MSKAIVLSVVTVVAVTATAVPTALLLKSESNYNPPESIKWPSKVIPRLISAKSIRSDHPKIACLTEYYGSMIVWNKEGHKDTEFNDIKDFSSDSKSCLLVEYYKQEYTGDKWWGEFKLIWVLKDDKNEQGLVTVINARTNNKKLLGNSAAYTLKKNDYKTYWLASRHKEILESEKNNDGLKNLIPQTTLKDSASVLSNTNYWGFNPTLNNICGKEDCKSTKSPEIHNYYRWEFTANNGGSEVYSWNSNIDHWLRQIFGWLKIKNKMNKVKGNWQMKSS